jgi:hypothetical protein
MKTIVSILLTIICAIAIPVAALLFQVDRYVLQSEPIIRAAQEGKTFNTLVPSLADTYITPEVLHESGLELLPRDEAVSIVTSSLSAHWVETTLTQIITEAFKLREPGTDLTDLNLTIQLVEPKQNFLTALSGREFGEGEEAFHPALLASTVPAQLNLAHFLVPRQQTENPEATQDPSDPLGIKDYASPLSADEIALIKQVTPLQLTLAQRAMAALHAGLPAFAALCVIAFVTLIIVNVGHGRHITRWIAAGTFFPGILCITLSLVDDIIVAELLDQKLAELPSTLHGMIRGFVTPYAAHLFDPFIVIGSTCVGVAIAAITIGLIFHHRHQPDHTI